MNYGVMELSALASALAIVAALTAYIARVSGSHKAHEDLCAQRYAAIEQHQAQAEKASDERHALFVKVSDERHKENLDRLGSIDGKLQRIIEAHMFRAESK